MDIKLNQLFSNKQLLLFKIIKVLENRFYDIQFEIDGLILTNQFHFNILKGDCLHTNIKYKKNPYLKVFFHDCYLKALLCKTRREFQINFRSEYGLLFRNKWLEYACSHMVSKVNFYTKEECLEKALLCKTKIEFIKKYKNYYHQAHRHGWVNEITNHTIKNYKYTKQECLEIALKYKRRIDFQLKDNKIYKFSRYHNWLDELCNHMKWFGGNKWTIDECYRLALKCNSRKEFALKYPNAYDASLKRLKCLNEICDHMKSINQLEFPRLIYAYEFEDKSIYIGLTKNFNQRKLHRNRNIKDSVTAYIIQTGLKPKIKFLTNLIPAELAQLKEQEFIDKYRNEGYNILNKVRGGSLGGSITKRIV